MALVAWKLLRDSRRLSEARAEALAEFAESDADEAEIDIEERDDEAREVEPVVNVAPARVIRSMPHFAPALAEDWSDRQMARTPPLPSFSPTSSSSPAPTLSPMLFGVSTEPEMPLEEPAPAMFGAVQARRAGRRWVAIAAGFAVLAGAAGAIVVLRSTGAVIDIGTAAARTERKTTPDVRPLELLSLTHSVDIDGTFVVTGLVKGPADQPSPLGIVAVVYVFDLQGHYVATAQAALDRPALAPGEESPFVVRVNVPAPVGRYRVGFRADKVGVMPHLDRRSTGPVHSAPTDDDESQEPGAGVLPLPPVARPMQGRVRT
jgi:hypothetical protein